MRLTTERLVLRDFTADDVDFVYRVHQHPGVAIFLDSQVSTDLEGARRQLMRFRSLNDHPLHHFFCVTLPDDTPVGMILFKPIPASAGVEIDDVEIGWRQDADHAGRGYITEAARAVLAHGLAGGLPRIVAVTHPLNTASMAVCRRLGMAHRGLTRDYYDAELELFVAEPGVGLSEGAVVQ